MAGLARRSALLSSRAPLFSARASFSYSSSAQPLIALLDSLSANSPHLLDSSAPLPPSSPHHAPPSRLSRPLTMPFSAPDFSRITVSTSSVRPGASAVTGAALVERGPRCTCGCNPRGRNGSLPSARSPWPLTVVGTADGSPLGAEE